MKIFFKSTKQSKWFNIYIYEKKRLSEVDIWHFMISNRTNSLQIFANGGGCSWSQRALCRRYVLLNGRVGWLRRKVQDWWLGSHDEKIQIFRQRSLNGTHLEGSNFMQTDGHFSEIYPLQCMVWVGISSWPLSHVMVLLDAFGTLMFDIRYPSLFLWKTWIT